MEVLEELKRIERRHARVLEISKFEFIKTTIFFHQNDNVERIGFQDLSRVITGSLTCNSFSISKMHI